MPRRIYPTRFGQMHMRGRDGERLERPTYAPDRLGYGFSDAPPWALSLEQSLAEQGSQSAAPIAPAADRADIRPLDVASALTILLAEVRAGLGLPGDAATIQIPLQAARELVFLFLQRLPEDPNDVPAWTSALIHADAVFQSSIERALDVVTRWRDVPTTVVDAAKEARTLFDSALDDKPENPLWLRPEWMGLVPMLQRFRRRRRNARRRMSDPDYSSGSLDENGELPATVKEQG